MEPKQADKVIIQFSLWNPSIHPSVYPSPLSLVLHNSMCSGQVKYACMHTANPHSFS